MKILRCATILVAMASPVFAGQYDQTLIEYCEKAAVKPALKLPEAEAAEKYCDGVAPVETVSTLKARASVLRDAAAAREASVVSPPPPAAPVQAQRPATPRPDAAASCRTIIAAAQNEMEKEKKIGAVSGYVNMSRMHQLGRVIVECQDIIKNAKAPLRQPPASNTPNPTSHRIPVPN